MVAIPPIDKTYSIEEYLEREELTEYKSEYWNGKLHSMPGGTLNHNTIGGNIIGIFKQFFKTANQKCRVLTSDMKIQIPEYRHFVYPDCTVVCDKPEFFNDRKDVITNPLLIVEVLSEKTEGYDRGKKFDKYRTLKSFREYVLVSQTEPSIDVYYRKSEKEDLWQIRHSEGMDATVFLDSIGCELKLSEVYEMIEFDESNTSEKEQ